MPIGRHALLAASLLCLLIAAARSAPARNHRAKEPEMRSLIGLWKEIFVEFESVDQSQDLVRDPHWLIKADTITMFDGPKTDGADRGGWHYKLTPGNGPMEIDLITDLDGRKITYPCLILLDQDKFTFCLQNFPERGRPRDMISLPKSGVGRFVFQRVKDGSP